jgi:hypothetical protein
MGSAGMTGKSSGAGKCVMPNVCQSTTSVFSRFAVGFDAIHAGMPWEGSPDVCGTWRPAGWICVSSSGFGQYFLLLKFGVGYEFWDEVFTSPYHSESE